MPGMMWPLIVLGITAMAQAVHGQYVVKLVQETDTGLAIRLHLDGKGPAKYGV